MKDPKTFAADMKRREREGIESVAPQMAGSTIGEVVLSMRKAGTELTWSTLADELRALEEFGRLDASWYRAARALVEGEP